MISAVLGGLASACGGETQGTTTADAGFQRADADETEGVTVVVAPRAGCRVATPWACGAVGVCCDLDERCLPGTGSTNVCVPAGPLGAGDRCSGATDRCGAGMLCASLRGELRCRTLCATALDCLGRACEAALEIGGELVRLCVERVD